MFIDEMQRSRIWQLLENAISEITKNNSHVSDLLLP